MGLQLLDLMALTEGSSSPRTTENEGISAPGIRPKSCLGHRVLVSPECTSALTLEGPVFSQNRMSNASYFGEESGDDRCISHSV